MDELMSLARFLVGGYFVWSGSRKFGSASTFWSQIMGYKIAKPGQARILAAVLPPLEFVAGLLFAAGVLPLITGPILLLLLLMFTSAIVISLVKKTGNDCGCGGAALVSPGLVVRNLVLAALVVAGMFSLTSPYPGALLIGLVGLLLVGVLGTNRYRSLGQ